MFVSLNCQTSNPAISAGENRKFAFAKGEVRESASRFVTRPDSPTVKAFFYVINMSNNTPKDVSLDRSLDIINAMSALDCAIQRADKITRSSGNSYAREEFSEKSHDTMLALGLALYEQLSTIYKEEQL